MMRALVLALLACHGKATDAAPATAPADRAPSIELAPIAPDALCATHGTIGTDLRLADPTVRAVARTSRGDAAMLAFRYLGPSEHVRELASGDARHQLGLKLRAQDSCNVVYVMWRLDKPRLDVSVKRNSGKQTHEQCGTDGYTKLRGKTARVPELAPGTTHALHAEIIEDELTAWIDDRVAWRGPLPATARAIAGPAGFRTDNIALEIEQFSASLAQEQAARCPHVATADD